MRFFGKRFGKRPEEKSQEQPTTPRAQIDPAKNKDLIRVFDSYGRELFMTRQHWRDGVLLGSLKKARNKPDELYNLIVSALKEGNKGTSLISRSRSSRGAERILQAESLGGARCPLLTPKRPAAIHARAQ
jgi:hypothetical protein